MQKVCNCLESLEWHPWASFPTVKNRIPQKAGLYFLRWGPTMKVNWCNLRLRDVSAESLTRNGQRREGVLKAKLRVLGAASRPDECSLLYIGKAAIGSRGKRGLRWRIWEYYGSSIVFDRFPDWALNNDGPGFSHRGGNVVWVLDGAIENVEFAWVEQERLCTVFGDTLIGDCTTTDLMPSVADAERALIDSCSESMQTHVDAEEVSSRGLTFPFGNMQ